MNDKWGREVEIRINWAHTDFPTADAQYHKKFYDAFMVIPKYTNLSTHYGAVDDEALKEDIDLMYVNQTESTWTSIKLFSKYFSFVGPLYRPQMFTNLLNYFGDDFVVISMEGCTKAIGFRD